MNSTAHLRRTSSTVTPLSLAMATASSKSENPTVGATSAIGVSPTPSSASPAVSHGLSTGSSSAAATPKHARGGSGGPSVDSSYASAGNVTSARRQLVESLMTTPHGPPLPSVPQHPSVAGGGILVSSGNHNPSAHSSVSPRQLSPAPHAVSANDALLFPLAAISPSGAPGPQLVSSGHAHPSAQPAPAAVGSGASSSRNSSMSSSTSVYGSMEAHSSEPNAPFVRSTLQGSHDEVSPAGSNPIRTSPHPPSARVPPLHGNMPQGRGEAHSTASSTDSLRLAEEANASANPPIHPIHGVGVDPNEPIGGEGASQQSLSPQESPIVALARAMIEQHLLVPAHERRRQKSVLLREDDIKTVLLAVREVFMSQPMLLELAAPVKICGDIHGQYYDLLKIFDKCGYPCPPELAADGKGASYLFLGDYVDRGKHSIETIMLLFCYKILYPNCVWLLRGNHECAAVTRLYGFYDDVKRRYNIRLWKAFTDVFNTMPCCGVISGKIICMHGGLSPDLTDVQLVNRIDRPCDVPDRGLLCDILWSDPDTDGNSGFLPSARGVGYTFGEDIVSEFLEFVDMDLVVRAHEVMERGYGFFADRQLVTIFSAPNYCGEFDNDGAVMVVDEKLQCSFTILRASEAR